MSSDECWVLGLSLCMFLIKSLITFYPFMLTLGCNYSFHLDFEVVLKLIIYSNVIQVYFPKIVFLFSIDWPYRYSWYQSLSLELELARIGSSDLGGLCVCEGPCRWISEFVWVFLVTSWFLFTIDWLLIDCTVMNWPLDCYCLTVVLLLFDCYFVIDLLVYVAN